MTDQMNVSLNGHETEDYYTTSTGATVKFLGVSPTFIDKLQNAGTLPEIPVRKYMTEFGEEQTEPMTEEEPKSPEEQAEWDAYVEKRDAILDRRNQNFIRAIFAKGVEVDESHVEEWKQEQEEIWGLEVPTNKVDLKVEYIQNELVGNAEDIINIITGVLGKTGIPEEAMTEVREMFRSSLRRGAVAEAETAEG